MSLSLRSAKAKLTRAKNALDTLCKGAEGVITPLETLQGNEEDIVGKLQGQKGTIRRKALPLKGARNQLEEAINNLTDNFDRLGEKEKGSERAECEQRIETAWDSVAHADSLLGLMTEAETDIAQSIDNILQRKERRRTAQERVNGAQSSTQPMQAANSYQVQMATQLPLRLQVPKFTGKRSDWENFWSIFKANIEDQAIPTMLKFNYLINALQGEAREAVNRFQVADENYTEVIKWLQQKYGKDSLLIDELYRKLEDYEAEGNSARAQTRLLDEVSTAMVQLKNKGHDINHKWLLNVIFRKFKGPLQTKILEKRSKLSSVEEWTWDKFYEVADNLLNKEEEIDRAKATLTRNEGTKEAPKSQTNRRPCIYRRRKNHQSSECRTVPPKERITYLSKQKLCMNCGKPNHMAQECRSPGCFKCGKKHHPSICDPSQSSFEDPRTREFGTQKRQAGETGPTKKPREAQEAHKGKRQVEGPRQYSYQNRGAKVNEITNETSSEPDTEEYVGHIASKEKAKTVLLTGVAKIQGKKGSRNVRILFDTGSELSFIDSELTQELQLPQIGEERLRINTFGSKKAEIGTYPIVEADLFDGDEGKYQVTL
ncbi:zinc knuckle [Ancylostoma duodenale]|uniref:Zinc knuckle n=1 Tax=Ancylostoma duodenale TaxID=51022 RepID=A0A0C2C9Z4_9BILA|nr:zinc knuckle [Ancylostoma duodenale]